MDGIKDIIRKRLSVQHRGRNMIGSISLNEVKSYLKIEKIDSEIQNEILSGYVRHDKLFLKTTYQILKIEIFRKKLDMLEKINSKLMEVGYKTEIKDIILK